MCCNLKLRSRHSSFMVPCMWPCTKNGLHNRYFSKKTPSQMDFLNQLEQLIFKLKKYHNVILIFSSNNHHIQFVFPASFLKFHSSVSLLTTSLYVFLGHPLIELAPTYNFRHLIGRNSLQILYITKM